MLTLRFRVKLWCLIVNPGIEYLSIRRDLENIVWENVTLWLLNII